jgi:hypothetical protein
MGTAWGSAVGNLIGFYILGGALTTRSIGGFVGNFFLGLVPYRIWHRVFKEEPHCRTLASLLKFEFVILTHAGVVALIIPLWTELVGFVPFTPLAFIILFNELISAGIISPIEVRTVPACHRSSKKEDGRCEAPHRPSISARGLQGGLRGSCLAQRAEGPPQALTVSPEGSVSRSSRS